MQIEFFKYQGTGNDFVILDNRKHSFDKNDTKLIAKLCDRKFGIGADGLILLENHPSCDFKMVYYNSDGRESSMCGNGGRCLVAFAKLLGIIDQNANFEAIDGFHQAYIENDLIHLKMQDVATIENYTNHVFLDTGSPHHVTLVKDLKSFDVVRTGSSIRRGAPYFEKGTNVNFVEQADTDIFSVRTYERGVENETLSCGTGVTAVALAMHHLKKSSEAVRLLTPGGELKVVFKKTTKGYEDIYLIGPACMVFKGTYLC
ncbi:MAG: diaminopimelate epimerase [Flavobacteriaceae bacterium]|nr:diaminopimelate epimerase [Flavobacteriaceae bacterium]MDZ4148398.1 diaminopimelate epimerase [Flavobacteriaceae bacterium]